MLVERFRRIIVIMLRVRAKMVNDELEPDVVVVEDNEDEARMTTMALKRINPPPTVYVIPDGELALQKLAGPTPMRPKVILLDLKLPKVHGLEVLEAIKSDPRRTTPVLILTSSDHPIDVERATELGCDAYLCKPVDWDQYRRLIHDSTSKYLQA